MLNFVSVKKSYSLKEVCFRLFEIVLICVALSFVFVFLLLHASNMSRNSTLPLFLPSYLLNVLSLFIKARSYQFGFSLWVAVQCHVHLERFHSPLRSDWTLWTPRYTENNTQNSIEVWGLVHNISKIGVMPTTFSTPNSCCLCTYSPSTNKNLH